MAKMLQSDEREPESECWLRFHWLHVLHVYREHYLTVYMNNQVRLYDNRSDSGIHGEFRQHSSNSFELIVHWQGNNGPFYHALFFQRSQLNRHQWQGFERGIPLCVLTLLDTWGDPEDL